MALDDQIRALLKSTRTIGVVGLSEKSWRPSHDVAAYLRSVGYTIVPINPKIKTVLGLPAYPDLLTAAREHPIEIVDIFRRAEFVPDIVEQAIAIQARAVWMQLGVIHREAARRAHDAGLVVVMDRCIKVEYQRWRDSEETESWTR
jgi:predicted CoA-binding protein